MNTATIQIEGMHCEGCARTIQALIGAEPGVHAVDISHERGRARVLYDPQCIGEGRLIEVIEKAGYRVPAPEA